MFRVLPLVLCSAMVLSALPASARCLDTLPAKGNATVTGEAEIVVVSSRDGDASDCAYGGNLVVRVKRGSALMTTFLFHDGEAVIVDWEHERVSGRFKNGVSVNFTKRVATVSKRYARMELVLRTATGGRERWMFARELVPDAFDDTGFVFYPR